MLEAVALLEAAALQEEAVLLFVRGFIYLDVVVKCSGFKLFI